MLALWMHGTQAPELRKLVPDGFPQLLYVDHIETEGEPLFQLACKRDLEGIVAKHRHSRYLLTDDNPGWLKFRNPRYSQMIGRDELFERKYEAQGAPEIGWDVCDKATAAVV